MRPGKWIMRIVVVCVFALASAAWSQEAGKEPTKAAIARQAKAATALVEVARGFQHGSAFCIHDSGIFLTNEHVVGGVKEVKLILHPGLKGQQILTARVVRVNKDQDLALLRVENRPDKVEFVTLPLGSVEGLEELADIIAVGFPFGKQLSVEKGEYPAVSVNAGRITSLRLKKGELELIQMDAALNPGNSGGPVLDAKGKVIGVVVSGVRGTTLTFAIPVSRVQRFVARPEIEPIVPGVAYAGRHKPIEFQARLAWFVPVKEKTSVELILANKGAKERSFPMVERDGVYRIKTEPLAKMEGPAVLRVTLSYADGVVEGLVTDRPFKVGKQELRLSEVQSLQFGPAPRAVLMGGKVVTGPLTGLDPLPVQVAGETLPWKLAKAIDAAVQPAGDDTRVDYTFVVRQGGNEVARLKDTLAFRDAPGGGEQNRVVSLTDKAPRDWFLKPAEPGTKIISNRDYAIAALPLEIKGGTLLLRTSADWDSWLPPNAVRANKNGTIYALVRWKYLGKEQASDLTFTRLAREGWTEVKGKVATTFNQGEDWQWKAVKMDMKAGDIVVGFKELSWNGIAVLFVFKERSVSQQD